MVAVMRNLFMNGNSCYRYLEYSSSQTQKCHPPYTLNGRYNSTGFWLLITLHTFQYSKPLFLFNAVSSLSQSLRSILLFHNFTAVHTTVSSSIGFREQVEYTR